MHHIFHASVSPAECCRVSLRLQWFGDLVTCDYWGELWLNEGFATYFENYGATAARPAYRFYDNFYAAQASYGLLTDAKNISTHPLATIQGEIQCDDNVTLIYTVMALCVF